MNRVWVERGIWGALALGALVMVIIGGTGVFESEFTRGLSDTMATDFGDIELRIHNEFVADDGTFHVGMDIENRTGKPLAVPKWTNVRLKDRAGHEYPGRFVTENIMAELQPRARQAMEWTFDLPKQAKLPMVLKFQISTHMAEATTSEDMHILLQGRMSGHSDSPRQNNPSTSQASGSRP